MSDPIISAARFLADHLEWLRHRPEADEVLADIEACARIVAGIARGPAAQKYLGRCGAEPQCTGMTARWCPVHGDCACLDWRALSDPRCPLHAETSNHPGAPCEGDVYARETASVGRCRTCGAEVSTDARRAWLDAEVRSHAFRAAHIAQAYGVNVKTIRSWAERGHLIPHGEDRDGRPLYNVGDVLDLAVADKARKAEDQARRARRATRRDNAA